MHINQVKTARYIGEFIIKTHNNNKIDLVYDPSIDLNYLKDDSARIYLFVQDGIIKKIGGSAAKGGIIATMSFYINAIQGSPGVPRFVLHHLIYQALADNHEVKLYLINSPKTKAFVSGLFQMHEVEIASFKEMENICKADYYKYENKYPDWNFQENNEPYPGELAQLHNLYHQSRLNRGGE